MNDRDFVNSVETTAERLTRIAAWVQTPGRDDHRTPIQRNRDGWHGHPKAAAYDRSAPSAPRTDSIDDADPDLGWRRTTPDPTGDAAIRPDRAATSRRKVERDLRAAANIVANLERELVAWGEPRPATDYERRLVEQANTKPPAGCESCARIDHYETPHAKDVCRDCYDFTRRNGRWPTERELHAKHDARAVGRGKLRVIDVA